MSLQFKNLFHKKLTQYIVVNINIIMNDVTETCFI